MTSKKLTTAFLLSLLILPAAVPAGSTEGCDEIAEVAILVTNSVLLQTAVQVTGDVVGNAASPGPVIDEGAEVALDKNTVVTGVVRGDTVDLDSGAAATGGVECNNGSGAPCNGVTLPIVDPLPAFQPASVRANAADVAVAAGQTLTLDPGEYGDVTIAQTGTLVLAGGIYEVRSVSSVTTAGGQCPFPCRQLLYDAPADLRVEGRFELDKNSKIGPSGAGASASDLLVQVGGVNGGPLPLSAPLAAVVGRESSVAATFYVPAGTFNLERQSSMTGAVIARDAMIDRQSTFTEDTYFNRAPTADSISVDTGGATSIEITLTGNDPDGGDLSFAISDDPDNGTLTNLTLNPAPTAQRCSLSATSCSIDADCPAGQTCELQQGAVNSATVTYTPFSPALEEEDAFEFTVTDDCGLTGSAVVTINPVDTSPPDPGPLVVTASDVATDTTPETPVEIALLAGGPNGSTLTFSVESLPAAGSLADSGGTPITAVPASLPDNLVTYTPNAGTATDGFQFGATDGTTSDTASVSIGVGDAFRLAPDQQLVTAPETPIQIVLEANSGGAGTPAGQGPQSAGFSSGIAGAGSAGEGRATMQAGPPVEIDAAVAWNVADSTGDGFGDESNADNPSWPATPGLAGAAVDQAGGPGSNGTTRIQIEFDISNLTGSNVEAATVELATSQGGVDSLDTFFYTGDASGNGTLENSDFEAAATQLAGVVMPVSGAGSFSVDVATRLQAAIDAGFTHFVVQGRVDEQLTGPARGLQVRSACATCAGADPPTLVVTTGGQPNLTITDFTAPASVTLDEPIGDLLVATVTNTGDAVLAAGSTATVGYYVSVDETITTADRLLAGGRENLSQQAPNGLAPGESVVIDLFSGANVSSTVPDANPPSGDIFLGVLVDEFNIVAESDETDNTGAVASFVEGAGAAPIEWKLLSLPAPSAGTLTDLAGAPVTVNQTFATKPTVVFTPATGFTGLASFSYQATQASIVDTALVEIDVFVFGNCVADSIFCDDGRSGGVGGQAPIAAPPGSSSMTLVTEGPGTIAAAVFGVGHRQQTQACSGECSARFLPGDTLVVSARPEGADAEFVGWRGACGGGNRPLTLTTMSEGKRCVAVFRTVDR